MASLREVRDAVFPGAAWAGPAEPARLEALVGWVRVLRARVPAFDTLDPGDLVVVPASALPVVAPTPAGRAELVAAFEAADVAAVLVVGGEEVRAADPTAPGAFGAPGLAGDQGSSAGGSDEPGLALAAASGAAGLPAFRLAGADPGVLERSLIGFLVNRRAELEHQAGLLEQRLERLALGEADLPGLVGEIGAFLGRAVALEGRRGDALAVHATLDDPSAAAAVGRYLVGSRSAALRTPLPAAAVRPGLSPERGAATAGSLVLLGERPATELERIVATRIAGLLALELARDEAVRRAQDGARRSEALPADGPPWAVLVARQVAPDGTASIEQREEARRELRVLAPARRMSLRGSAESLELRAVLAADERDPGGLVLAERIAGFLGRTVAISRPFSASADRPAAEADARATLEAIEALAALDRGAAPPPVARADRLPAYRLLGAVHSVPDGPRLARALLAPLLEGRPVAVAERLATLRAILDAPGPAEAAASLRIHRNTLAYRLRRIEALTGWRLADPGLRLPLATAVRLVQTAQGGDTEP